MLIIGQKLINFHQKIFKYHSHREQFQLPSIWIIMEVKLYDTKIEMHMSFYPKNTSGTKKEAVERWRTREVRDGLSTFRCQPQAEPEHYNWDFEKSWSKKNHSILLTTDFGITWPNSPSHPPESRLNPVLLDCSWEGWYDGVPAVEYLAVDPPPTHVLPVRPAWLSTLSFCPPQFLNFISFFMTKFTTVASPHLRRGSRARVSALFYSVQLVLL